MKTPLISSFQKAIRLGVATISLAVLTLPALVSALSYGPGASTSDSSQRKNAAMCSKLNPLGASYNLKINARKNTLDQNRAARDTKLKAAQDAWQQAITAKRAQWDQIRADNFKKLEQKATTDAQKVAVTAYEQAVADAVSTRRSAYDAAHKAFQASLAKAISDRRSMINSQISTLQDQVNTNLTTAIANCTSQGRAAITQLRMDIKSDRQSFTAGVKTDDKVRLEMAQLQATRKLADNTADQAFRAAMKAAREALLTAFKGSNISIQ